MPMSARCCSRSRPRRRCTPPCRHRRRAPNAQFEAGDYTASLQTLAALRAPVDAFFDGVMVNAEELDLRLNRLGLLKSLHDGHEPRGRSVAPGGLTGCNAETGTDDPDETRHPRPRRHHQRDSDDFIKSADEWKPLPGALEAIARLNHAGWHVVVASNQSGLGRGLFDVASLNAMHAKMHKHAGRGGRARRRGVLLSARARRGLPLPQAAAGPVRADWRAFRRRPQGRAGGGRFGARPAWPVPRWVASRIWC